MNDNTNDTMNPLLSSVSTVSTLPDGSHFVPYPHQYNMNYNNNINNQHHIIYQQQSNQFSGNSQINPQIQSQQMMFNAHLAHNSMANQFGNGIRYYYTTKNISCPGCKLHEIKCKEYKDGSCIYGHATKSEKKGQELFCDFGRKADQGGGCTHPKCNRKHIFQGTNFHSVKCPRECGRGARRGNECFLHKLGKCPYFHNGLIGKNGFEKWKQGKPAYGVPPPSNINQYDDTDQKLDDNKSTQDLACILPECQNGNVCKNLYGHPNKDNGKQYYCQYDKACHYGISSCRNNHDYKWSTDATPKEYICQFWAKGGKGCKSDANQCRMYHPNGKKSKDH